ncbi:MAG: hypothetical protein COZ69_15360 [Deltaproteobacteria bacterium CG_4_8_14_3_um_filter_45_9]|jgi:hypothetical protein|nr:MAG: hypothetical protein COZ69_15360 [Deltaproteobacteria bacterium CG_4_8_14_3_um_filter_45_9]
MDNSFFTTKDDKKFFSSILNKEDIEESTSEEEAPSNGQNGLSLSLYYVELVNRIKASLSAMKTFAFLSRDNFKDQELGEEFYKIVNEDIGKTISLLDCFNDYINFSTPMIKKNTVNTFVEEVIKKHESQFEEKKIKIIKKQFEKDLPETIVPDEHLRYILNSVIQYILLSIPSNGSVGFLTRFFDVEAFKGKERNQLQKDGKYLEILVVSTGYEKWGDQVEVVPGTSAYYQQEEAIELILKLAKEIIKKNKGMMRFKIYDEKPMTFISLILPIERRNVVHYPSPEERLKRAMVVEK